MKNHNHDSNMNYSLVITVFICIIIFTVSSFSFGPSETPTPELLSIGYHFGIYFFLACFCFLSAKNKKYLAFAVCFSILYACFDELHQLFVP